MPDPREPGSVDLIWLLEMTHEEYLERFRGTAVRRAKHWMLQRNAAVALGNVGGSEAISHLERAMRTNENPIVRGHAAWAIGRIGARLKVPEAGGPLVRCLQTETDESVREEIELAIQELDRGHGSC